MKSEKLTKNDIEKIQEEIDHRKLVLRPQILKAVQEARAHGDLSENFEYYAARRENGQNNSRIRYLENILRTAEIIEDEAAADEVGLDKLVTVYFEEDKAEEDYRIVTAIRGNSRKGLISSESPLGSALMGHRAGDRVEVKIDGGAGYFVQIKKVVKQAEDDDEIRKY